MKNMISFLLAVTIFGASAQAAAKKEPGLEKVKFRMAWFPVATDALFTVGIKKGFFKEEGIELELLSTKGSPLTIQLVGSGDADFAVASGESALIARSKGVPVKSLAVIHQNLPTSIWSLKSMNIEKAKDLEGKKVAPIFGTTNHSHFLAFARKQGINLDKVRIMPFTSVNMSLLVTGEVDAISAPGWDARPFFKKNGLEYNELRYRDHGIRLYGNAMITNDTVLREKPDLVRRLTRAVLRSWRYAYEDPEEASRSFVEHYPDVPIDEIQERIKIFVETMTSEDTVTHGIGYQKKERWEEAQNFLVENKLMEKKIDIREIFTSEYLK